MGQTVQPAEWVIVNDGSSDRTGALIDKLSARLPWLHAVHRVNRGYRKSGGGVHDAFNDGYERLRCRDWDYIVKLDGDLSFEPSYSSTALPVSLPTQPLELLEARYISRSGTKRVLRSVSGLSRSGRNQDLPSCLLAEPRRPHGRSWLGHIG